MTDPVVSQPPRQYTVGFLAGSFGLTIEQAREMLASAGDDRTTAAELARKKKASGNF